MNSVSKIKIVAGYALLLAVLLFSLFFVRREMENLILADESDVQWTDSVLALIREKDANTIKLLRTLNEASSSMVPTREIEQIIARQDSAVAQQRVQHHVITHRDTVVIRPRKRGFFRRLGEVFVPPKKDTAIQVKTSLEFVTDTVIEPYNPVDSLQERLRVVARQRQAANTVAQKRKRYLQRMDHQLTARIDSLLKDYEAETLSHDRAEAEHQQAVRQRSARIIGGIAVGAVLLSILFLIIIGRDIARNNRYRRELEEARRRAEELLAVREKLMLAITHDFKAPLGSIMGYADLLSRLTVDERQRFYLDNMKASSEHLLKLVVDLLDFHRLDLNKAEVNRVTFQPSHLLKEIHVSFEPLAAAKSLPLHCNIAPELSGTYICDPLRLRQIISNLLSNAVKFTDSGSITLTARFEAQQLVVAIADTGRGMEPADCERIFQEFTRLPSAQGKEGFGLGLSIVRMLVQLLEGTIEVDSVPGKGSTFTLRIPIYLVSNEGLKNKQKESGCTVAPQEDSSCFTPPPSFKHLLLIDDDRIQLTLTAAMLRQNGMEVVSCLQLDELLDALRTTTFDALLTDVQMPAISGFDLLKLLRASNIPQAQSIPVIAVTARSDMRREDFLAHGFAGCLHKPFTIRELLCEISGMPEGEEVPMASVSGDTPATVGAAYNFSALTAFASDAAGAAAILESFRSELRLDITRLEEAAAAHDMSRMAAVSHKLIPLFTLLEAVEPVKLLRLLESAGDRPFSDEWATRVAILLGMLKEVLRQVPVE
ncbi:MAG: hybrid sensor histidine kinase/response regulator [Bacteroides sp.]|nr:hybrid sensor histidine kinase/response regulator [Bacteroides sp.]